MTMQETKAMGEVDEMFMRLAISGKARRGKDTLRTPLIEEHGIVPVSFADPMREVMRHVTGLSAEELEAIKTKRTTPEIRAKLPPSLRALSDEELGDRYRNTMQFLGTECYRVQWAPDTWTFEFEKRLANAVDAGAPGVVLADLRFENEFTYLKEKGFAMVRISGPDFSDALTGEKARVRSVSTRSRRRASSTSTCGTTGPCRHTSSRTRSCTPSGTG